MEIKIKIPKSIIDSDDEETFDEFIDQIERDNGPIDKQSLVLKGLQLTVNLIK